MRPKGLKAGKDAGMKTVKTRSNQRSSYTYTDAMGRRHILKPGIHPDTGELITEETIKILHRMDDREVENNVKNTRTSVQDWEKPILEAWKKDHPDMDLPTRLHISIDISVESDEGKEEDTDKGLVAKASMAAEKTEDPMIERLHEVVEMLRPDQQELYRRIVVDEISMADVARELGLDSSAIRHRMATIRKFIKENF